MMERELPVITIEGTDFIVDVNKLELIEKADHKNTIPFEDMRDVGDGYTFEYSQKNKNLPGLFDRESTTVKIPEFVMLDPIGMADKYNHSVDGIKGKSDFDLMVNQEAYDMRVNKGILPTVDIAGHTFYVDIRMDMLRPKDDFLSKGIVFSHIENYYDEEKRTYTIPYNPKTREFQEPDYLNIKELPKDLIAVRFPSERLLDRIGWNRKYGFEIRHGLVRHGLKLQFAAKKVPWKNTFLVDLIKSNLKAEKKQEKATGKQQLIQPKQNKGRRI
jgi:hypothetical protein